MRQPVHHSPEGDGGRRRRDNPRRSRIGSDGDEDGVPVCTIFTNAQMAEIVKKKVKTLAELGNVEGVGTSRIEKYGEVPLG